MNIPIDNLTFARQSKLTNHATQRFEKREIFEAQFLEKVAQRRLPFVVFPTQISTHDNNDDEC